MSDIIDITQPLEIGMPVWPGDTEFSSYWTAKLAAGAAVNVGAVTMSLHSGTHADAPLHFLGEGRAIDECDPGAFIGRALVVDACDSDRILERHIVSLGPNSAKRLLFKTCSDARDEFRDDFSYFSAEAVRALGRLETVLVGTDSPSVDRFDSTSLEIHKTLGANGISILENLRLHHVSAGEYELIALPLRIVGMDASPVRAILRRI